MRSPQDSHDVGLVHRCDVAPVIIPCILKGKLCNALTRCLGDELDALHDSIDDLRETESCPAQRV